MRLVYFASLRLAARSDAAPADRAEDGIRDLVRSRGLGDVYKRQRQDGPRKVALKGGPRGGLQTEMTMRANKTGKIIIIIIIIIVYYNKNTDNRRHGKTILLLLVLLLLTTTTKNYYCPRDSIASIPL